jgi:hypothetical protein
MAQVRHTRLVCSIYLREETVLIEFKLPNPSWLLQPPRTIKIPPHPPLAKGGQPRSGGGIC